MRSLFYTALTSLAPVANLRYPCRQWVFPALRTSLVACALTVAVALSGCRPEPGSFPKEPPLPENPAAAMRPSQATADQYAEFGSSLADVRGLFVGHHTLSERPTGCSVVLAPEGAVAGVAQRGGAPGTRELGLLDPTNSVQQIHGVVLSGGSAFGLDAASGVVRHLEQRGIGYDVGVAKVPIVVGAILFDLAVGNQPEVRPTAQCGYLAAETAANTPEAAGNVGAGAGATVGKLNGIANAMKGGLASASITTQDGLVVAAMVAVNAIGDVIDPATGAVVAGVRGSEGKTLADARRLIRLPANAPSRPAENTTIGVVATNAELTKAQATKLAQMSDDGLARALYPAHTPGDGDTIFALATGSWRGNANLGRIGALGAEVVAEAILRAVEAADSLEGLPSATELQTARSH